MLPKFLHGFICVYLVVTFLDSAHAVLRPVEKIVATGDTLPAGAGSSLFFETLQTGMINNSGEVAFLGSIDNPVGDLLYKNGIWVKSNGTFDERVRAGEIASGYESGVNPRFSDFRDTTFNDVGQVGFLGYTDHATDRDGYWASSATTIVPFAIEGQSADGIPGEFGNFYYAPALNNSGQMVFNGAVVAPSPSMTRSGILRVDPNGVEVVTLEGEPAPGTSGNFAPIYRHYPPINAAGETAFSIGLRNPSTGIEDGRAVYRGNGSSLELVAASGMAAPGTDATFNSNGFASTIRLNSAGDVAFGLGLTGVGVNGLNDTGLWRTRGSSLELVAREGDVAPLGSDNHLFSIFISSLIDDTDQVVFKAYISNALPALQASLWSERNGELSAIAANGMAAPGTGDTFSSLLNGTFATNSLGQVVFQAIAGEKSGIWAQDPSGALRLIVRAGDTVEIAPGDVRTIAGFDPLYLSNGTDGKSRSFNDAGQLVFNATFVGGGEGIFVSDVAGYYLADFDRDGDVDTDDLDDWRSAYSAGTAGGDADGDGVSSGRDFLIWQRQAGLGTVAGSIAVPEPTGAALILIGCVAMNGRRSTRCN